MIDRENGEKPLPTWLQRLSLRAFRNYSSIDLELSPGLTLVVGPNGHGKTNLIEAINFLCLGRSYRERSNRRVIMFGARQARLHGELEWDGSGHNIEIVLDSDGNKAAKMDGAALGRMSELVGKVPVVSLTPEDGDLVGGEPGARRRFLDLILAQSDRVYLEALRRYRRVLLQRNASLREGRQALAETYEVPLIENAVVIRQKRAALTEFLAGSAGETYNTISQQDENFTVCYRPNPAGEVSNRHDVTEALARARDIDAERGFTSVGPHRDDVYMEVDGRQLRTYGSHGQARTALATLKLAEVSYYAEVYDRPPLLVMDEVTAVLDRTRAANLVGLLADMSSQVFVTSPSEEDLSAVAGAAGCIVDVDRGRAKTRR